MKKSIFFLEKLPGEMWSATSGEKQSPIHGYIPGITQLESSLEGKNLGGPGEQQVECKAAMCPCPKEGQQ